jgi:hypothetical protein
MAEKETTPADAAEVEDLELSMDEANVHGGATVIQAPGQAAKGPKN